MAEEKKGGIAGFFEEFKKFITRGNVLDMAVGVIVGGAFTAIVNGLSNFILKPLINWLIAAILGKDGLSGAITPLSMAFKDVVDANGVVIGQEYDLANSIYIDWGSFISAVINFFIIAFVLFVIVKTINGLNEAREKAIDGIDLDERKEVARIMKEQKLSKKDAQAAYEKLVEEAKAKKAEEEAAAAAAAAEAEAKAAAEAEAKATANTRLLEEIRDLLKNK